MIFTALSPNTQKDDYKLALQVLFDISGYWKGKYPDKVKGWFREFFRVKYAVTYESARTALYFILKELGIGEGDEVIIQAFTCVAAVNPIKWVRATPVFVDIDPANFNLDFDDLVNKVNGNTKAIIVQHTFGYPSKIKEVINLARERGIFVIEDCAHTIGTELEGRKLGTFGDASFFSFGRDKAISASFGGVAVTNNKGLGRKLEEGEKFLSFPSRIWIARQILYTIVAYLTRKFYTTFYLGKLIHFIFSRSGVILTATTEGEKRRSEMSEYAKSKLPNSFTKLVFNQLKKLDVINRKRSELLTLYVKRLTRMGLEGVGLPEWKLSKNLFPLRFPLLVKKRDKFMEFAKKRNILLGDWYDVPVAPRQVDLTSASYKQGSCPNAEKVCEDIINLPIHVNLSEQDALRVIAVIKDFYS